MSTATDAVSIALKGATFVAEMITRFIDGDDSAPVRRVLHVLPAGLRSEVALDRQEADARREIERAVAEWNGG